ncbi:unnamed protein product [Rhizophagus irregularis]|nr:unnamed protein product [Rhizophagus irregularis]CAB4419527.1 unnamed protein product [Rhizophagus irregularis]
MIIKNRQKKKDKGKTCQRNFLNMECSKNKDLRTRMKVNKWAAFKNRAPQFETRILWTCRIHQFNNKTHVMSLVQWTQMLMKMNMV